MALLDETAAVAATVKERFDTAREQIKTSARDGKRLVIQAKHAAEDGADKLALQVRRHPLSATVVAAATGAVIGGLVGYFAGRRDRTSGAHRPA